MCSYLRGLFSLFLRKILYLVYTRIMKLLKSLLPNPVALGIASIYFILSLILSFDKLLSLWFQIPILIVGLFFGLLLVQIDRLYLHHLYRSTEDEALVTQSLLFLGLFIPLSFFVVTSTGSILGGGIIVGFLASTLASLFSLRSNKELLEKTYFFQLKRPLTQMEVQIVMGAMILWNILIWLFALL